MYERLEVSRQVIFRARLHARLIEKERAAPYCITGGIIFFYHCQSLTWQIHLPHSKRFQKKELDAKRTK